MTEREWKPGDKALLPVTIVSRCPDTEPWWEADVGSEEDGYRMSVRAADLIPDERRPPWWPPQPGDVAEWGGKRRGRSADGEWWNFADSVWEAATDDDVPADAVLVLPAKTRGVQTWGDRQSDDWIVSGPAKTREA